MSLCLASSNDNPVRAHPADMLAEHWQEQEAHDYGFLVVFGATCFLFGTLFASAVMIVLAKLF